jgi:hypothetical protein
MYFVGDVEHNFVNDYLEGFVIYLHEKGQFWLSSQMVKLGQPKRMYIPLNTEQES